MYAGHIMYYTGTMDRVWYIRVEHLHFRERMRSRITSGFSNVQSAHTPNFAAHSGANGKADKMPRVAVRARKRHTFHACLMVLIILYIHGNVYRCFSSANRVEEKAHLCVCLRVGPKMRRTCKRDALVCRRRRRFAFGGGNKSNRVIACARRSPIFYSNKQWIILYTTRTYARI